jgi:hypothetical protein
MRRVYRRVYLCVLAVFGLVFAIAPLAPAAAKPAPALDLSSIESVQRWMYLYRERRDVARLPAAMRALSRLGAFKDPESSGVYVGFMAGVLGYNPGKADALVAKMFPLTAQDQWVVVRAIAYSGLPEWKALLRRVESRMPTRQVMIERYVSGKLPTLADIANDERPGFLERMRGYFTIDALRGQKPQKKVSFEWSGELIDTLLGYYLATGSDRPILRIVAMLPWAADRDNVEKLTVGSMAKYTLAINSVRDAELLAVLKRVRASQPKETASALGEVIDAAESVDTVRLRKEALAAIEEIKRKGSASKRNASFWGKVGQGALALGCIAAAVAGAVELGVPCIIGGAASSAALNYWSAQD